MLLSVAVLASVSLLTACSTQKDSGQQGSKHQGGAQQNSDQTASGQQGSDQQSGENGRSEARISVVTTIFPPYDFVREIAGDRVELKMLLKPGEESHSYEPTPQDIIAIQESDVFIYTGGENDVWVEDILSSMPEGDRLTLRIIDCVDTVEEEHVEGMKESPGHDHDDHEEDDTDPDGGEAGEDTHSVHEIDEHVWTSPVNAALIVERIKEILIQADPSGEAVYEENAAAYEEELAKLDQEFRDVADHARRKLLIFGDRFPFRYFADEYGLDYYAAFPGCAGDTEPSAATMAFLIDKVKEEKVSAVLKMELSNDDIANAIAEATGTEVKVFYSCHNLSAEDFESGETYLSMMQKNVETLKEVLNGWR
ncbi:MAG TPA: metal ABC transporter substrate-binding protein [Candidatus Mediterraneibacter caccavium]|uniref:Metal ABC transporter substrate-binding protein n=1 Tax=Candidatus Mediterraneibacter caccavium TaxID=2838661 RepID=A0A9D1VWH5_9FIRM|nr:metal ABC transporter substrate-binding protein [Candidatus Mediterraneibacter caccavium]